ncbi:TonB family protein [bacterium AH-315-K03]|nr:TonB family protein [bacterium AH-315-K03]
MRLHAMKAFVLAGILLSLVSLSTQAAVPYKIEVKSFNNKEITQLGLVGASIQQRLSKPIYIASLYSANKSTVFSADNTMVMDLRIIDPSLSHKTLSNIWRDGIIINSGNEITEGESQNISKFVSLLGSELINKQPRFVPGDRLQFIYQPQYGTTIKLNQSDLGVFSGDLLFPLLLNSWIGKIPPSSDFKKGIMSASNGAPEKLYSEYDTLAPMPGRVKAVKQAIAKRNELKVARATIRAIEREKAAAEKAMLSLAPQKTQELLADINEIAINEEEEEELAKSLEVEQQQIKDAEIKESIKQYKSTLAKLIRKFQIFPRKAISRKFSGNVLLSITVNRYGYFTYGIKTSSGHKSLDNAALNAVAKAKEVVVNSDTPPEYPEVIEENSFSFDLRISYQLKIGPSHRLGQSSLKK